MISLRIRPLVSAAIVIPAVWLGAGTAAAQSVVQAGPADSSAGGAVVAERSQPASPSGGLADSSVVIPGPRYRKSALWATFAGRHYRDLWVTPIRVPVLDLRHYAGGLTPLDTHSGSQTKSLRLAGADGREYQFRSVDKDPTAKLDPAIRHSAYARSLHDGVSASFPAAPLVANALLESAGVLVDRQFLTVMPDDPALGSFRDEFKGVLGLLEERPTGADEEDPGSTGLARVISPTALFRRVDASPDDRVDAAAFLRARLMDIYMGDRDRHRDQFRWVTSGDAHPRLWRPISRDHDEAFVQLDGLALHLAAIYYPPLVTFGPQYPKDYRLNWHAREVDRRFLVPLGRAAWDSVAAALQATLTDAAIDSAVRRMPPEMYPVGGARLARVLRARRDGLEREALRYYHFLAGEVEIRGTDASEVAEVTRLDSHHLDVTIRARDDSAPYFERRFDDRETQEIRLMMWSGDDQVVVRGAAAPNIRLRVVGGAGDDRFVDSTRTGSAKFYDDQGQNAAVGSRRVAINGKPHQEWVGSDTVRYPPRDWGTWWRPVPWVAANSDLGLFIGGGFLRTQYGFRREPFASEIRLRAGYSTSAQSGRADLDGEFHPENTAHFWRVHLGASGVEVLRFYGFGNATPDPGLSDFYRVSQQRYAVEPAFVLPVGHAVQVSVGPFARYTRTTDNAGRFIAPLRDTLLGGRNLGQVGGRLAVEVDTRDRPVLSRRGFHLSVAGEVSPAVWDVPSTYGAAEASADAFVSAPLPGSPTLALRARGRRVWGTFPFFDAASLGGPSSLPGFHSHRFAGDASLDGGAQLRLSLGRTFLALPAAWGVYGSANAGRVYLDGDSPDGWHTSGGGGLWLAFFDHRDVLSVGAATSSEGTLLQGGMAFGF